MARYQKHLCVQYSFCLRTHNIIIYHVVRTRCLAISREIVFRISFDHRIHHKHFVSSKIEMLKLMNVSTVRWEGINSRKTSVISLIFSYGVLKPNYDVKITLYVFNNKHFFFKYYSCSFFVRNTFFVSRKNAFRSSSVYALSVCIQRVGGTLRSCCSIDVP